METIQTVEQFDYEEIRAILRETAELGKEIDQDLQEIADLQKENDKIIGRLGNCLDEMVVQQWPTEFISPGATR
jgi:regulator of replication initiation timing